MKIIQTADERPENLSSFEREMIYNGLDCCVTAEVFEAIEPQLDEHTRPTYEFSKALQGPAMEMRLRGVLIDQHRKEQVIDEYFNLLEKLNANLERIVFEGCGLPHFNWRSGADLQTLFYDRLRIPPVKKGSRPTTDRAALEKIEVYTIAKPIVAHIKAMRDLGKKISMLRTSIDPDGRMRTSYNIAGTSTGRFSSSFSEFGTGGNLQNVEESLRSIFVADPGMKFAKFDAKSGESYAVGAIEWNLFGDDRYLNACSEGDPHTATARVCWPKLKWTGNLKLDKDIAESPYYRHYTYRFMCKKLGHGSNYGGKPQTLAGQTKLPIQVVSEFQPKYFLAYPAHLHWHAHVDSTIRKTGQLISLTGRKRHFFGRRNDEKVLREAIAYDPQCSLADIVNRAMLNIWLAQTATIMMQDHDALTFQYPAEMEDEIVPKLIKQLAITIPLKHGRVLEIPYDAKTGWNRGDYCCGQRKPECGQCQRTANPEGLKDYSPSDQRQRRAATHLLDRSFR